MYLHLYAGIHAYTYAQMDRWGVIIY